MLKLKSPAKINLFLRILNKRPDGYHELASLMQVISLFDILHISLAGADLLTCTDATLPTDGSNLVLKAADLFRRKTGLTCGVRAHLEKNIPHQAGLGGGSGNAATTLWALNQLTSYGASDSELAAWAGEIGSDISFFLSHGTAYCTGRGEKLQDVQKLVSQPLWIIKPAEGLSTPAVYKNLNLAQVQQRDPEEYLQHFINGSHRYFNDLEAPALQLMPSLHHLKNTLHNSGFHTVLMSGSGSAFFCLGEGQPPEGVFCSRVQFMNRESGSWFN